MNEIIGEAEHHNELIEKLINDSYIPEKLGSNYRNVKTVEYAPTTNPGRESCQKALSLTEDYLLMARRGRATVLYKSDLDYLEDKQYQRDFQEYMNSLSKPTLQESRKFEETSNAESVIEQSLQLKDEYLLNHQRSRGKAVPIEAASLQSN